MVKGNDRRQQAVEGQRGKQDVEDNEEYVFG